MKLTCFTMWLNYRFLLQQLVSKDIKLKYRRSYLGYIWSILNPLLMMMVLVIVFSNLFRFDIPNFATYLLTGQLVFGFVNEATTASTASITSNATLLKKTYIPAYIFTIAKVSSALVNMLFSMIALIIVMIFSNTAVTWYILCLPLIIAELYLFSLGLGMILATITVFFRDIQYLWGVFTSIWMYLSPVIYPVSIIPKEYRWWYDNINPMYGYIYQFREIVLYGRSLPWDYFIVGAITAVLFILVGFWIFKNNQDKFILYI